MANSIGTRLDSQLNNVSKTLEHLKELQLVTSTCDFPESIPASWLLREHFMDVLDRQFDELYDTLKKQALPLLADIKIIGIQRSA